MTTILFQSDSMLSEGEARLGLLPLWKRCHIEQLQHQARDSDVLAVPMELTISSVPQPQVPKFMGQTRQGVSEARFCWGWQWR